MTGLTIHGARNANTPAGVATPDSVAATAARAAEHAKASTMRMVERDFDLGLTQRMAQFEARIVRQ